jgi:regulatory protein
MDRVEKAALRLIARAEQNSFGLAHKLERRGFNADEIKSLISSLIERDLLNDARYAELWVRSRLAQKKAHSPLWLRMSLEKRGIDRESAKKTLEKLLDPDTEHALLLRFLEKIEILDTKNMAYLRPQLKNEGFSFEVIEKYFEK